MKCTENSKMPVHIHPAMQDTDGLNDITCLPVINYMRPNRDFEVSVAHIAFLPGAL